MTKNNKLEAYKTLHNHTWESLSEKIGITTANLHRINSGKVVNIKMSTVNKIKKVTGLSPSDYIK